MSGASLEYFAGLTELDRLYVSRITQCTDQDVASLNGLPKLRDLTLRGEIPGSALVSLDDLPGLWSFTVHTTEPIAHQTVAELNNVWKARVHPLPRRTSAPATECPSTTNSNESASETMVKVATMKRLRIAAVCGVLGLLGPVAGFGIEETSLPTPTLSPGPTRIVSFPADALLRNLYVEPESGSGWDPERVCLSWSWESLGPARGDVIVPADRHIWLRIILSLRAEDSRRLAGQDPTRYQIFTDGRVRTNPGDLSGLSGLGPGDLYRLAVISPVPLSDADERVMKLISRLTGLEVLCLDNTGVNDRGMEPLRELTSLKALELREPRVTNQGLAVLKDLPALEFLDLETGTTDIGLRYLGQLPNLRWLRIRMGRIWGPGLAELAHAPRLERLCLWGGTQITDRHIAHLEGLTQLKSLTLWGDACSHLTDASLVSIGKLTHLEELHFIRVVPRFTAAGVAHLKALKHLKAIDFGLVWVGPPGEQYGDEVARKLQRCLSLNRWKGSVIFRPKGSGRLPNFAISRAWASRSKTAIRITMVRRVCRIWRAFARWKCCGFTQAIRWPMWMLRAWSRWKSERPEHRRLGRGRRRSDLHRQDEAVGAFGSECQNASSLNHLNGLSNLQYLKAGAWPREGETAPVDELTLDLSGLRSMKDLCLGGLSLCDADLAFLENLHSLEILMLQPTTSVTGASLRHLRGLPRLHTLWVFGLSDCTGDDLRT